MFDVGLVFFGTLEENITGQINIFQSITCRGCDQKESF
jgi:hypothetical protein